jgi:hypothetical protein
MILIKIMSENKVVREVGPMDLLEAWLWLETNPEQGRQSYHFYFEDDELMEEVSHQLSMVPPPLPGQALDPLPIIDLVRAGAGVNRVTAERAVRLLALHRGIPLIL